MKIRKDASDSPAARTISINRPNQPDGTQMEYATTAAAVRTETTQKAYSTFRNFRDRPQSRVDWRGLFKKMEARYARVP